MSGTRVEGGLAVVLVTLCSLATAFDSNPDSLGSYFKNINKFRTIPRVFDPSNPTKPLRTTLSSKGVSHLPSIVWKLKRAEGNNIFVDLNLTKISWNDNFRIHLARGRVYKPSMQEKLQHHCTYHGRIRESSKLTASISTCGGLRGQLNLGKGKVMNIRPLRIMPFDAPRPLLTVHTTYHFDGKRMVGERIRKNSVSTMNDVSIAASSNQPPRSKRRVGGRTESIFEIHQGVRRKKQTNWYGEVGRDENKKLLKGYGTNEDTRYVELFVVADHAMYKKFNEFWTLVKRIKNILQVANALTRDVNFFLVFKGLEVWNKEDEVPIPNMKVFDIGVFKNHTQKLSLKHDFDLVVYIVANTFSSMYGQSFVGKMCSPSYAYIVVADVSQYFTYAASTLAHGLAHTLNVSHDGLHCRCKADGPCIMHEANNMDLLKTKWSECSKTAVQKYIKGGGGHCLENRPTETLFGPTCGDGLMEEGEECDCGILEYGNCVFSPCCEPLTCKLKEKAVCSTGSCCNTTTCQYHPKGEMCRKPKTESCDIMETCTGVSSTCPEDVYVKSGSRCSVAGKAAMCYKGECLNHLSQCRKMYGEEAEVANKLCYIYQNIEGRPGGSCGSKSVEQFYPACEARDVWCGTLHCNHPSVKSDEEPKSMEGLHVLWTSLSNRTFRNELFHCKWVVYEVGKDYRDPGLVKDGTPCGDNSMCLDSRCVSLHQLKLPKCPLCLNGGRCTHQGTCDCGTNYLPPFCEKQVPNYGPRTAMVNVASPNRGFMLGSIVACLLFLAVVFVLGLAIRHFVFNAGSPYKLGFKRNFEKNKTRNERDLSNNSNGYAPPVEPLKPSPLSSPNEGRKGTNKMPSVRTYDISNPLFQSSTNNHLTQLTAKDSTSTTDSLSTADEPDQLYPPFVKPSTKPTPTQEVLYANDVVKSSLNALMTSRLLNGSKQELMQAPVEQCAGLEAPATPGMRYENVDDVKVQKDEADEAQKAIYANLHPLKQPLSSSSSQLPQDSTFTPVKYDNIDDLISVRCPLFQADNGSCLPLEASKPPQAHIYAFPATKANAGTSKHKV